MNSAARLPERSGTRLPTPDSVTSLPCGSFLFDAQESPRTTRLAVVEKLLCRLNILVVMKVRENGGEKPPHIER